MSGRGGKQEKISKPARNRTPVFQPVAWSLYLLSYPGSYTYKVVEKAIRAICGLHKFRPHGLHRKYQIKKIPVNEY
jgi:hypothetical protein